MKVSTRICTCILIILAAAPLTNRAEEAVTPAVEEKSLPWEKGSISLGGYVAAFNSEMSFDAGGGGVNINGEDLLDLDSSLTVLRVDAMYRPGKSRRNQLDFYYAGYHRSGSAVLTREITVDGVTYPVGAEVDTVFNFDIIRGNYSYAVFQNHRVRIALGIGIYVVPLKVSFDGTTSSGREKVEAANTTLPLPAFSLSGEFQIIPKLFLYGNVHPMYLEISDFKGSLLEVNVGLEYRPWKQVGFGVGYNSMAMNVEGETTDSDYPGVNFEGKVTIAYSGLIVYGKFMF